VPILFRCAVGQGLDALQNLLGRLFAGHDLLEQMAQRFDARSQADALAKARHWSCSGGANAVVNTGRINRPSPGR
jgi:hypothetical protein